MSETTAASLRRGLFAKRETIKALKAQGFTRADITSAVRAIRRDDEFPTDDATFAAELIAAELTVGMTATQAAAVDWDGFLHKGRPGEES